MIIGPSAGRFYLKGASDNTLIGNIGDRLKTETLITDKDGGYLGLTSFGEGRMIEKNVKVEVKFYYNISTAILNDTSINGGTATQLNRLARLQTSSATNGVAKLVTKDSVDYKVSEDLEMSNTAIFNYVTGVVGSQIGVAGSKSKIGGFTQNEQNGIYFGFEGAETFSVFYAREGGETKINQANFSHDKLDGTGEYTPDWTKIQLIRVFYAWHGVSPFIFQIQKSNGAWLTFHIETFVNQSAFSSIGIPLLSLGAKIENTGNNTNLEINWQAGQISILGKEDLASSSRFFSIRNLKTVTSTLTPIFSIRNKTDYASQTNYLNLFLEFISVASSGNKAVTFVLVKNGTLTNFNWIDTDTINSITQTDKTADTITGGEEVLPIAIGSSANYIDVIERLKIRVLPGETITLAGISASSNDTRCGLRWREVH